MAKEQVGGWQYLYDKVKGVGMHVDHVVGWVALYCGYVNKCDMMCKAGVGSRRRPMSKLGEWQ